MGTPSYEQVYLASLGSPVNNDASHFYLQKCNNDKDKGNE